LTRILVIEDDPSILLGLERNLKFEGYEVMSAEDGERGLQMAVDKSPDLIVLDIMLPKLNGYELCRHLRKIKISVPIIMLTARGQEIDKVMGLELGADDYVTKPFSIVELLARIKAVLRRAKRSEEEMASFTFNNVEIDFERHIVMKDGELLNLSAREFDLLKFLISNNGKALSRSAILNEVWGYDYYGTQRTVDNLISNLRQKLETDPDNPEYILTVWGVGYRFLTET
jgi:two-component system alkaline phosphatase synthesis response regulator PhoP